MPWERRLYRGNKVWILFDEAGAPVLDERQLASLRYKPEDERTYTVRPDELQAVPAPAPPDAEEAPEDPIEVWADARVLRPGGPAGIGVVLVWRGRTREISRALGPVPLPEAAGLAVLEGLNAIRRPRLPVTVHTPHLETVRALRAGGREGAHSPLAEELRRVIRRFSNLTFVPSPSGDAGGPPSRAAELARGAIDAAC